VTPEGDTYHESSVILEYLDFLNENRESPSTLRLFPKDSLTRLKVKQIEARCDAIQEILIQWITEWYLPTARAKINFRNFAFKVNGALDTFEDLVGWIEAHHFTAADVSLGCLLSYLDFRFSRIIHWRKNREQLTTWYDSFRERPSIRANPFKDG
jgi:glutathione S-transferase